MRSLVMREYIMESLLDAYELGAAALEHRQPRPKDHPCAGCQQVAGSVPWAITSLQNFSGRFETLLRAVATEYDGPAVGMGAGSDRLVLHLSQPCGKRPPLLPAAEREAVIGWLRFRRRVAAEVTAAELDALLADWGRAWDACEQVLRAFMAWLTEEGRHERIWIYQA
jgi:hypothetical protein